MSKTKSLSDRLIDSFIDNHAKKGNKYAKAVREYNGKSEKMGWNIYHPKSSWKDFFKKQYVVHMVFKYKVFHFAVWLVRKFLYKYIEQDVPKEHYNKPMQIFDKSYDNAIKMWCLTYMRQQDKNKPRKNIESSFEQLYNFKDIKKGSHTLLTVKRMALAIPINDTAYSEFLNLFMFELYKSMNKEYGGKQIKHLFYNDPTGFDVTYYSLSKIFDKENNKYIQEVNPYEYTYNIEI